MGAGGEQGQGGVLGESLRQAVEVRTGFQYRIAVALSAVVPVQQFRYHQLAVVAAEDIEAVRLGTHRKLLQQYKGAVGLPSHQAVDGGKGAAGGCGGRTKAGLRPAARQERRQKHHAP